MSRKSTAVRRALSPELTAEVGEKAMLSAEGELLGRHVQEARKQRKWTQKMLAERAGLSHSEIVKIEGGKPHRSDTLRKIHTALGISGAGDGYSGAEKLRVTNESNAERIGGELDPDDNKMGCGFEKEEDGVENKRFPIPYWMHDGDPASYAVRITSTNVIEGFSIHDYVVCSPKASHYDGMIAAYKIMLPTRRYEEGIGHVLMNPDRPGFITILRGNRAFRKFRSIEVERRKEIVLYLHPVVVRVSRVI